MPLYIEWIGFGATLISLFISIWTLITSLSVKKQVQQKFERNSLKSDILKIQSKIDGFVNSINQDYIFKSDNDRTFKPNLSQFLTGLSTDYTFLTHKSRRIINSLQKTLNNPNLTNDDWGKVANELITLKNNLKKESFN